MDTATLDTYIAQVTDGALLTPEVIKTLCFSVRSLLIEEPNLLQLETNSVQGSIFVCGDVHGQFHDFIQVFSTIASPTNDKHRFLFLGDLVDRGFKGIEIVTLLFLYKLRYPDRFYFIRGNHEARSANLDYGFYKECSYKYSSLVWDLVSEVFDSFPIAAVSTCSFL